MHIARTSIFCFITTSLLFTHYAWGATEVSPSKVDQLLKAGATPLLQFIDERSDPYPNVDRTVEMRLKDKNGEGKTIEMQVKIKEGTKTAVRFQKPTDLKGMSIVMKGANEIYVKLPGSSKVRRVASHARKQGFQGTDWSLDDMKTFRFSGNFDAKIVSKDGDTLKMELNRKASSSLPYARLLITVPKKHLLIQKIEYFDDAGVNVKRQTRKNLKFDADGHGTYYTVTMFDLIREHSTELVVVKQATNKPIPKKVFSKRWMIRGS